MVRHESSQVDAELQPIADESDDESNTAAHNVNVSTTVANGGSSNTNQDQHFDDDESKKEVTCCTWFLLIELIIITIVNAVLWSDKKPSVITTNLDNTQEICNIQAINDHKQDAVSIYHILQICYVVLRLIYLLYVQGCQLRLGSSQTKSRQTFCNSLMIVLGFISTMFSNALLIYIGCFDSQTIEETTDHVFITQDTHSIGFYNTFGFTCMWAIDALIFMTVWLCHCSHKGAVYFYEIYNSSCNTRYDIWEYGYGCASFCVVGYGLLTCVMLIGMATDNDITVRTGDEFVSLDLKMVDMSNSSRSGIYRYNYSNTMTQDTDTTGDDLVLMTINDPAHEMYIYGHCATFDINNKNYANVKYKGARFDNVASCDSDDTEYCQIYAYCEHLKGDHDFINCYIHKLDLQDNVISSFYVSPNTCKTVNNIMTAAVWDNTTAIQLLDVVFTVCYDSFVVDGL